MNSIIDEFLIDTTRLALVPNFTHPFQVDKPYLTSQKRDALLELLEQRKHQIAEEEKQVQLEKEAATNVVDNEGVDPSQPSTNSNADLVHANIATNDSDKMDIDEPSTTGAANADKEVAKAVQEREEKETHLRELDIKIKEMEDKIEALEDEKTTLVIQLKQVLAEEKKAEEEHKRRMAEEQAKIALLQQQHQQQPQNVSGQPQNGNTMTYPLASQPPTIVIAQDSSSASRDPQLHTTTATPISHDSPDRGRGNEKKRPYSSMETSTSHSGGGSSYNSPRGSYYNSSHYSYRESSHGGSSYHHGGSGWRNNYSSSSSSYSNSYR